MRIIDKCHHVADGSSQEKRNLAREKKIFLSFFFHISALKKLKHIIHRSPNSATAISTEEGINIEFITWPIIRYKREVLFGWIDLLVSFGGIAGLFLGFSLLSGIEIIYYFTVRAGCMMYKNRVSLRDDTINWIALNFHSTTANCHYPFFFSTSHSLLYTIVVVRSFGMPTIKLNCRPLAQQQLYEIQQEEDSRPIVKYDLSLIPKFKRSVTDIQMVRPVETLSSAEAITPSDTFTYLGRYNKNHFNDGGVMEKNENQQRRDDFLPTTNEKIDESNRAFPTPRSRLLLFSNRQIVVDGESIRRNVGESQVNK
jgi:hypothetical protein